ncbi:MAG TPA: putative porin [Steroidobacteraceae bacterium]|nr:putative porin [Steroidobacteraceae bacterium]
MTHKLVSLAVSGVLAAATGLAPTPALAQSAEIAELKAQLAALTAKIDALEKAQEQTKKTTDEAQATADRTADVVAQNRAALSFAGDIRYRNESFDVQYVDRDRNRDRVRARFNANFRVNDTVTGRIGIATGGSDPRSSNQTLTDQNSRKDFELDMAYLTWAPNARWRITGGKQPYSFTRTGSLFYDGDVNPEGISVNYATGNFFAGAFYDWLAERALSFSNVTTGTNVDSIMFGGQLGYRIPLSDSTRLTLGATYMDFDGVQGYNPFFGGSSFGNTTTTSAAVCNRSLAAGTACLLSDFNVIEASADLTSSLGGQPFRFFLDYAQNMEAEVNAVAGKKLDTAYAAGVTFGAASANKGTWEVGLLYQTIEKDSLFGQLLDSDFGDGNTDSNGFVIRGGYTVARNWTVNATLFLNELSNDVPQNVTVFNDATTDLPYDSTVISNVFDREYKRLQLDLNFRF